MYLIDFIEKLNELKDEAPYAKVTINGWEFDGDPELIECKGYTDVSGNYQELPHIEIFKYKKRG